MDALQEWMVSDLDIIMAGSRRASMCHWHMDALREWMESDLDVIMVGTWLLCESTETASDE